MSLSARSAQVDSTVRLVGVQPWLDYVKVVSITFVVTWRAI